MSIYQMFNHAIDQSVNIYTTKYINKADNVYNYFFDASL
jgi:hypothetical protein